MREERDRFAGKYRIHSDRLPDWDYAGPGWYFITICTKHKVPCFGEITEDKVRLSEIGLIVEQEWEKTGVKRSNIILDKYVIMPKHFHAIISIRREQPVDPSSVETLRATSLRSIAQDDQPSRFTEISPKAGSLGTILRAFKAVVTRKARIMGHSDFAWQLGYYEHIIRDEEDLNRIRETIQLNPLRWALDPYHPS